MKKLLYILLSFLCLHATAQKSLQKPNPARLVVDNANAFASHDRQALEEKLVALDDNTSNQICVVTVPSLNGEVLEEVANKTFRDWGIGNKKTNNGILILVAVNDRKVRIEVGGGLEGAIPDVAANDIINNDIKPAFRQGNYISGINAAVDNLSKAAKGEYDVKKNKESNHKIHVGGIIKLIFFVILIIVFFASGSGGGRGGRNRGSGSWMLPLLFSGGGNSNWGGGGSSDFGGGGFGGFGGGSSGGGGASGSW